MENEFDDQNLVHDLPPKKRRWFFRWWAWILWFFLSLIFLAMAFIGWRAYRIYNYSPVYQAVGGNSCKLVNFNSSQLAVLRKILENSPTVAVGPSDAKVVVVEYGDFQCPYCLQSFSTIRQLMVKYGQQVRFIWRNFPAADLHPQALNAAIAALCANEQGKFWEMHDKLFLSQSKLADNIYSELAKQLNLDEIVFSSCFNQKKFVNAINLEYSEAIKLGVVGTPTFYLNGQKMEGPVPQATLECFIQQAIEQNK